MIGSTSSERPPAEEQCAEGEECEYVWLGDQATRLLKGWE
jgi:hypothetical protein